MFRDPFAIEEANSAALARIESQLSLPLGTKSAVAKASGPSIAWWRMENGHLRHEAAIGESQLNPAESFTVPTIERSWKHHGDD